MKSIWSISLRFIAVVGMTAVLSSCSGKNEGGDDRGDIGVGGDNKLNGTWVLNYSGERLKIKIVENLGTVSVNNDGFWGHLKVGDSYLKIGEKLVDKDNEWVCEFRAVNSAKELIWRYGTVKYIDIKGDDVLVVWKQESFDNFTKEK